MVLYITGCLSTEFQCNSTTCIDLIRRCDRTEDCSDGLDEKDCSKSPSPPPITSYHQFLLICQLIISTNYRCLFHNLSLSVYSFTFLYQFINILLFYLAWSRLLSNSIFLIYYLQCFGNAYLMIKKNEI